MHVDDTPPHPVWMILLLYRLLWPALMAEAIFIAMILRAGW
jgi:hypothetical protein